MRAQNIDEVLDVFFVQGTRKDTNSNDSLPVGRSDLGKVRAFTFLKQKNELCIKEISTPRQQDCHLFPDFERLAAEEMKEGVPG